MANRFSLQFKLGIGGIVTSIIWIASKLGLFSLSANIWLSGLGLILSFIIFYHFVDAQNKPVTLFSTLLFFYSLTTLIYFYHIEIMGSRSNFDFSFLIFATVFSLGAFFLSNIFVEKFEALSRIFLVSVTLFLSSFLVIITNPLIVKINFINELYKEIENYLDLALSISILLILIFPFKEIIKSFKKKQDDNLDVPLT